MRSLDSTVIKSEEKGKRKWRKSEEENKKRKAGREKREKRERFGFSKGDKIDKLIAYLYDTKQTYYATNEVGNIFEQFLETYKEGGYT